MLIVVNAVEAFLRQMIYNDYSDLSLPCLVLILLVILDYCERDMRFHSI